MQDEDTAMLFNAHRHGGYYNDGNSEYWADDYTIDMDNQIVTRESERSAYGQMGDGIPRYGLSSWVFRSIPWQVQKDVIDTLDPLISTAEKYQHRTEFRYFSVKHMRLIIGRVTKARMMINANQYDNWFDDNLSNLFILPAYKMALLIYADRQFFRIKIFRFESEN